MSELLALLAAAAEVAEDVTAVVGAIESIAQFADLFKQEKNHSSEILIHIDQMKSDILAAIHDSDLNDRIGKVFAAANHWYNIDQPEILKVGITEESLGDKGIFHNLKIEIRGAIDDFYDFIYYFSTRPDPTMPESPHIATVIVLCGTLLGIHLAIEIQIFSVMEKQTSGNAISTMQRHVAAMLGETGKLLDRWAEIYLANRRSLARWKTMVDPDPSIYPPSAAVIGYKVTSDGFAGDGFLGNQTGREIIKEVALHQDADHGLIRSAWNNSKAGAELQSISYKWRNASQTTVNSLVSFGLVG